MGLFLFASAIKSKSPIEIATAIKNYTKSRNIIAKVLTFAEWSSTQNTHIDLHDIISQPISITSIYHPQNRWSVVIYNNCHFEEKEICEYLSFQLKTLISFIKILDSEVWYHIVFYNGNQVDQFCSSPEIYEKQEEFKFYKGNTKKLAFYFEIEEYKIIPYLNQLNSENRPDFLFKKAHEDDKYALGDEWIFIDFWKRLGIIYPSVMPEIIILHEEVF
jgi:hypothetical protein